MCNSCDMSLKEVSKVFLLSNVNMMAGAQATILDQEGAWDSTLMYPHYQPWTVTFKRRWIKN